MEEAEAAVLTTAGTDISWPKERLRRLQDFFDRHYAGIVAVYLYKPVFGPGPYADIDLGILLAETPMENLPAEAEVEWAIEHALGLDADVRILNGAPPTFVSQLMRSGTLIVDRDAALRKDLSEELLRRYVEPFRGLAAIGSRSPGS